MAVKIQFESFDLNHILYEMKKDNTLVGAAVSFTGFVRDLSMINQAEQLISLYLEHYPGMTEKSIQRMLHEAQQRFEMISAKVIHRVGILNPLDQIVLVAVTSAHRGQSFQACEFLMDYLKTQAPFWKKETGPNGSHWVDARISDDQALARWGIQTKNALP